MLMKKLCILSAIIFFSTLQCIQSGEEYKPNRAEINQNDLSPATNTAVESKATFAGGRHCKPAGMVP